MLLGQSTEGAGAFCTRKRKMQRYGIRRKALITLLGVAVPSLIAFSVLILTSTAHILTQKAAKQVSSMALRSAAGLAELVDRSRTTLNTIATAPEVEAFVSALDTGDQALLSAKIKRLEQSFLGWQKLDYTLQAIRLVDPAGNVLVKIREGKVIAPVGAPRQPFGLPAVHSVAGRDFFRQALQLPRHGILVSNLERGKVEEEELFCPPMVRFATPLFRSDGSRAGVVIINVWGEQAGKLINHMITSDEGNAFLVERNLSDSRRNGIYLFHHDESCEFGDQTGSLRTIFTDFPKEITESWMTRDSGITRAPENNDILAHSYYSPYNRKDRGWVVVVHARRDFFLDPLSSIGKLIALWGFVVVILAGVASLFFARSLTGPIHRVVDSIRRMEQDPAARIAEDTPDEVGFLAGEINRMADAIQSNAEEKLRVEERIRNTEKLASVGEMAAGLAHELNTPLGNIKALAILAKKGIQQGECNRGELVADLDDIADQAGKCSGIIGGLLSFARRSEGTPMRHKPATLIQEAISLVRLRAEKNNVRIEYSASDEVPMLLVDGDQLRQVFVNILLNSIDAAPDSTVTISVSQNADELQFHFIDLGCGIPDEYRDKIFDPFFTTKEVGQGTGLGLSVSYGIIRTMGGNIELAPSEECGTHFIISLPADTKETA